MLDEMLLKTMDTAKPGRLKFDDPFFGNPVIADDAFISESSVVIGDIVVSQGVLIHPCAVIRIDEKSEKTIDRVNYRGAFIGKGVNFQDHTLLHAHGGKFIDGDDGVKYCVWVGSHCTFAHGAKIHGPSRVEKKTFIGFDAIINGSIVGRNCNVEDKAVIKNSTIGNFCHVGVNAVVKNVTIGDNKLVPDGWVVSNQETVDQLPSVSKKITDADNELNKGVVDENKVLCGILRKRQQELKKQRKRSVTGNMSVEALFLLIFELMQRLAAILGKTITFEEKKQEG